MAIEILIYITIPIIHKNWDSEGISAERYNF